MSNDNERAKDQARAQFESIKEMVAALNLDWDRLEEVREEKKDLRDTLTTAARDLKDYADNCNLRAASYLELKEANDEAEKALSDWEEENQEELDELEAEAGECKDADDARQRINEDPLSVQVRSGWYCPGSEDHSAEEFQILLCTGGPAVKIEGELGQWNQPESAEIFYQDWFTPWEPLELTSEEEEIVLEYCRCFYFGE